MGQRQAFLGVHSSGCAEKPRWPQALLDGYQRQFIGHFSAAVTASVNDNGDGGPSGWKGSISEVTASSLTTTLCKRGTRFLRGEVT